MLRPCASAEEAVGFGELFELFLGLVDLSGAQVGHHVGMVELRLVAVGAFRLLRRCLLRVACGVLGGHSNEGTRTALLRTALMIARSDGFVGSDEEHALRAAAQWLGISEAVYQHLWRSVIGEEPQEEGARAGSYNSEGVGYQDAAVPPDLATYYASVLGVSVAAWWPAASGTPTGTSCGSLAASPL